MQHRSDEPRIILVLGTLRSGSTLLGTILGGAPGFTSVGEAKNVWRAYTRNEECSCGLPAADCPVWGPAGTELGYLQDGVPTAHATHLHELADETLQLHRLIRPGRGSGLEARLGAAFGDLYRGVARQVGAHTVIDTSKTPNMCRVLRAGDVPVSVVHLVRDPRGVALSESSGKRTPNGDRAVDPPQRRRSGSAVHWAATNTLIEQQLVGGGVPHHRLRYEDLVTDPVTALAGLAQALGLGEPAWPIESTPFTAPAVQPLRTHQLAGNPNRFRRGRVPLALDLRWQDELSASSRLTMEWALKPWMRRYAYPPLAAGSPATCRDTDPRVPAREAA